MGLVKETYAEAPHEPDVIATEIGALHEIFSKELTPELSNLYLQSVVRRLGGVDQSFQSFEVQGEALHRFVGENVYGPLISGFADWVRRKAQDLGHQGNVYYALRDGAPLMAAAQVLWRDDNLTPVGIYGNRPLLGVDDEISPESSDSHLGLKYLEANGIRKNGNILWVDSGAWGTVVQVMKKTVLKDTNFYPYFWYSHNPHIPGYLNELQDEAGVSDKMLEVVNDSLECMFPQPYQRPNRIIMTENGPQVVLEDSVRLAVTWGKAAIEGVIASASSLGVTSRAEQAFHLHQLAQLHEAAVQTGEWQGVLPSNTPTWSKGQEFIDAWPVGLLP